MSHLRSGGRVILLVARTAVAALVVLATSTLQSHQTATEPGTTDAAKEFIRERLPLTDADLGAAEQGRTVVRTLDTTHPREVATIAVLTVAVPPAFYFNQLRNVAVFKDTSRDVLEIGTFSMPASVADVERLSLGQEELEKVARCRPEECAIQLSREAIDRIRRAFSEKGVDPRGAADRTFRQILVGLVDGYRRRGDSALMTYADMKQPVDVAGAFRGMISSPPAILSRFPVLSRHLASFPQISSDVEDMIYWSQQKLGGAIVVTVTHVSLAALDGPKVRGFSAASKQIYGSRYFDSSLGVTVVVSAGKRDGRPQSFLTYVNRSRIDALGGFWGRLARPVVRARTRSGIRKGLEAARSLVERRFEEARTDAPQ